MIKFSNKNQKAPADSRDFLIRRPVCCAKPRLAHCAKRGLAQHNTEIQNQKSNQKIEQTKNPAFLQDFEGPTLQGTWFATGTSIIANQKSLSSHHKLRAMEVGEVASPEPRWQTRASLLSTPMAGLLYQGQIENQMKNKNQKLNQKAPDKRPSDMDPARLALAFLRVKGSMLLYTSRARVHNIILKQKELSEKSPPCLTRRWARNICSLPYFYYTKPREDVNICDKF